ncbi:hypothetical protein BH11BAC2_BH11BAC2_08060 [soil metagenome]
MNRVNIKHFFGWLEKLFSRISESETGRGFQKRFPATSKFIAHRTDLYHFRGLTLTWLITGCIFNAFVVSEIAEEIIATGFFGVWDQKIALYFYQHRNPILSEYFYRFTQTGSAQFVVFILMLMFILAIFAKRYHAIVALLVSVSCSAFTAGFGKYFYQVPRPHELAYYQETNYSFPSGHATIAMAFYAFITYLLIMHSKRRLMGIFWFITGSIFIFLLAFSRIYLGVHYLSDVIGGLLIGMIWCFLSITLLAWLDYRKDHRLKSPLQ